jgi:hypothetical protein
MRMGIDAVTFVGEVQSLSQLLLSPERPSAGQKEDGKLSLGEREVIATADLNGDKCETQDCPVELKTS